MDQHSPIAVLMAIVLTIALYILRRKFMQVFLVSAKKSKHDPDAGDESKEAPYRHNGGTPTKKTWKEMDSMERAGTIMGMVMAAIILGMLFMGMAVMGGLGHLVNK